MRKPRYQVNIPLNEGDHEKLKQAKDLISYNNRQMLMLGVEITLDENRKLNEKTLDNL